MSKWKDFDKFYNNLLSEVYHEPDSMLTTQVTDRMLPGFLELFTTNEKILDLGCGAGYAMKKMREFGMKDVEGLTLSDEETYLWNLCRFTLNSITRKCICTTMYKL